MSKKTLSDSMIKATKPSSKDLRLFDGNGLYLLIKPNNLRGGRIDYTINKKRKTLSLGTYPLVTLAEARNSAFVTIDGLFSTFMSRSRIAMYLSTLL